MHDDDGSEVGQALADAGRARHRIRAAGRWFASYLLFMGVVTFVWIVALEALFPSGSARGYAVGAGGVALGLLTWWAESHDVHPQGAKRRGTIAWALWFGGYLLVIGPLVRWQAGTSLAWWSVAAAVLASPFFIAAWRARRHP